MAWPANRFRVMNFNFSISFGADSLDSGGEGNEREKENRSSGEEGRDNDAEIHLTSDYSRLLGPSLDTADDYTKLTLKPISHLISIQQQTATRQITVLGFTEGLVG